MCKFSHDDLAVAPGQLPFPPAMAGGMPLPGAGMPLMPLFGALPFVANAGQNAPYDPQDAQMDMHSRAQGNGPMSGRGMNGNGDANYRNGHGELPVIQDLTPSAPRTEASVVKRPSTPTPNAGIPQQDVRMASPSASTAGMNGIAPLQPLPPAARPTRGGNAAFRGRGRGGRGTFTGEHQNFPGEHQNRDSKTIVVEKIPEEHLSLEAVNGWFKRYGTVTNVAVDASGGKALVSFSTHAEAQAAWKAEEAIFNNRFVKTYWHRPMEGQGASGARMLQASAPIVANMAARAISTSSSGSEAPKPPTAPTAVATPRAKSAASADLSVLAAKQQLLEKKIAEQKVLMARLTKATPEEKKAIMARLRKLDELTTSSSDAVPTPSHPPVSKFVSADDKERRAKELLDMELDIHAKTSGDETGATSLPKSTDGEEGTSSLEEQLAKLRAEVRRRGDIFMFTSLMISLQASALGIDDTESQPYSSSFRGYRGRARGRGRASYRGAMRGGPPRASMKLDNRPKAVLVKGVTSHDPEIVQAVRDWYEVNRVSWNEGLGC